MTQEIFNIAVGIAGESAEVQAICAAVHTQAVKDDNTSINKNSQYKLL